MHCGPGSKRRIVGPQFVFWAAPLLESGEVPKAYLGG